MDPNRYDLFEHPFRQGFDKAGNDKSLKDFDVAPFVSVILGDDIEQCQFAVRAHLALYIGGMGAKGKNFYHDYATSLGYGEEANRIQDLYLAGKREEAMQAVPTKLIDACALTGPRERIIDQAQDWKAAGDKGHIGSMLIGTGQVEVLQLMAEIML